MGTALTAGGYHPQTCSCNLGRILVLQGGLKT